MGDFRPSRGYDGLVGYEERQRKKGGAKRFWLKPGWKRECIFLDDVPYRFDEHAIMETLNDGTRIPKEHAACLLQEDEHGRKFPVWPEDPRCVGCERKKYVARYHVGYYTILDTTEFEYNNKIYRNMVRLFPAKVGTMRKLESLKEDLGGSFAFRRMMISRTGAKTPRVGDQFTPVGEVKTFRDPKSGLFLIEDQQYWTKQRKEGHSGDRDSDFELVPPRPFDYAELFDPVRRKMTNQVLERLCDGLPANMDPWEEDAKAAEEAKSQGGDEQPETNTSSEQSVDYV